MVKGTLDWDTIDLEVCDAVEEFLKASKIPKHKFINARLLTSFVQDHPHKTLRPELIGGWFTIHMRLTTCMRRMGWPKWSGHVYIAPMDEKGKIIRPVRQENVPARAEA